MSESRSARSSSDPTRLRAALPEAVGTMMLMLVGPGTAILAGGLTLGMAHLATIPVDNTSVNPARTIAAAIFAGSHHLAQVWAFIVFPLIGGAVGLAAHRAVHESD